MGESIAIEPQTRRRRIIERPRLTRLLDESQGRIKMLVAPAGYGKTTLARQWLEGKQAVWYTATAASVDVAALAAGLQQTIGGVVAEAGAALLERLPVTRRADEEAEVLAGMLADDLPGWPTDAWLVLEDYETVAGSAPAERFVQELLREGAVNALILSRHRPAWASSRRILYGEIFQVSRESLAMTTAEAQALLRDQTLDTATLIDAAKGWPAVLSIASMSGASLPDLVGTPHLFQFFAEEVYRRLDRRARRGLTELSLFDSDGRRLVLDSLRPEEADHVIRSGIDTGFLSETSSGLEMHPLLRGFLERKIRDENPRQAKRVVSRAVRNLIDHGLWDEAFDLINRHGQLEQLPELVEASMDSLLGQGRTATLRTFASHAAVPTPIVLLARAELALREGRFHESEALAVMAAREVEEADLVARARLVAGRAAHVASRPQDAWAHYREAASIAESEDLKRHAEFGELQAAAELELTDVPDRVSQLAERPSLDPEEQVVLADRQIGVQTRYALQVDFSRGRAARQLLNLVPDPMTRTSFRNVFGYALAASARFDEALELTNEQMLDVERCRLDFVIPYALTIKAIVYCGRRDYVGAEELLAEADDRAFTAGDRTAMQISRAVRVRLYIAQAAFDVAVATATEVDSDTPLSLRAELTACKALALAGTGDLIGASAAAAEAASSAGVEARINVNATRAIVALRSASDESGAEHARRGLACALGTGLIESFVCAYRGFPDLLVCLLEQKSDHAAVARVLSLAGDGALAGVAAAPPHGSVLKLSPREKEVLGLLAQGLSNRDIGQALFISPVTVKVHVRHIFEKLGVKSRAAAALRAAQLGR